ncbi:hypothetical protein BDV12DRAFT_177874 [Aspergillus spectabilis]
MAPALAHRLRTRRGGGAAPFAYAVSFHVSTGQEPNNHAGSSLHQGEGAVLENHGRSGGS